MNDDIITMLNYLFFIFILLLIKHKYQGAHQYHSTSKIGITLILLSKTCLA